MNDTTRVNQRRIAKSPRLLVGLITLSLMLLPSLTPGAIALEMSPRVARSQTGPESEIQISREDENTYNLAVTLDASAEETWSVIADYGSFSHFLPNIISSEVLEIEGNRHVVEQVSEQQVLFLNIRSRIRTENLETENQRIDFRLLEGDLNQLEGSWMIETTEDGQIVRLTQTVTVAPPPGTPDGVFHTVFRQSLTDNLEAIRDEIQRRQMESTTNPS
ncbi:MAG: Polyketide cyclase / dehydrase and lipid transport [Phormidium sp. OSCR]|nr:MAG: Polyketide cyclase / dehydrase and lipid transport [Phormidium sp. OSCR]